MDKYTKQRSFVLSALVLLVVVGTAMRVAGVQGKLMQVDEAFSWRLGCSDWSDLISRTQADVHPPAYYMLLKLWSDAFGTSADSMRGLSILLSVMAIPATYLLCIEALKLDNFKSNRCQTSGLICAVFSAFHLSCVTGAQVARMYSLGLLLACMSSFFLLRSLRTNRSSHWIGFVLLSTALLYTHNYGLFTVFAYSLFSLFYLSTKESQRKANLAQAFGWFCLILALYLPWVPTLMYQSTQVRENYWIANLNWSFLFHAIYVWFAGIPNFGEPFWALPRPLDVGVFACLGMTLFLVLAWSVRQRRSVIFSLLIVVTPWLACVFVSLLNGQSILLVRCLFFTNFGVFLVVAIAYACHDDVLIRGIIGSIVCATVIQSMFVQLNSDSFHSDASITEAVKYVKQESNSADYVQARCPAEVLRVGYYLQQEGSSLPVFCTVEPNAGHTTHLAGLSETEVTYPQPPAKRLWRLGFSQPFVTDRRLDYEKFLAMDFRLAPENFDYFMGFYVRKEGNK